MSSATVTEFLDWVRLRGLLPPNQITSFLIQSKATGRFISLIVQDLEGTQASLLESIPRDWLSGSQQQRFLSLPKVYITAQVAQPSDNRHTLKSIPWKPTVPSAPPVTAEEYEKMDHWPFCCGALSLRDWQRKKRDLFNFFHSNQGALDAWVYKASSPRHRNGQLFQIIDGHRTKIAPPLHLTEAYESRHYACPLHKQEVTIEVVPRKAVKRYIVGIQNFTRIPRAFTVILRKIFF